MPPVVALADAALSKRNISGLFSSRLQEEV